MTSADATTTDVERTGAGHPNCPRCHYRMRVKQISPALLADDIDDTVYGCERCGTEAKRTVKRA